MSEFYEFFLSEISFQHPSCYKPAYLFSNSVCDHSLTCVHCYAASSLSVENIAIQSGEYIISYQHYYHDHLDS